MLNRLNGWQRIGVILSALWAAFILFAAVSDYRDSTRHHGPFVASVAAGPDPAGLDRVDFVETNGARTSHTWNDLTGQTAMLEERQLQVGPLLLWLVAPIVGGWFLVYALIFSVRWVAAGFKARA